MKAASSYLKGHAKKSLQGKFGSQEPRAPAELHALWCAGNVPTQHRERMNRQ
jgi:hypothetical protein